MTTARLAQFTAAPGQGASFIAVNHSGLVTVEPLSTAAEAWLRKHASEDSTWHGDALVVEIRFFADLADAIIAEGFLFERNAFPN